MGLTRAWFWSILPVNMVVTSVHNQILLTVKVNLFELTAVWKDSTPQTASTCIKISKNYLHPLRRLPRPSPFGAPSAGTPRFDHWNGKPGWNVQRHTEKLWKCVSRGKNTLSLRALYHHAHTKNRLNTTRNGREEAQKTKDSAC